MSLSLDDEDAQPEKRQKERFAAFAKMFGEGRSFSGHERNCCYLNPGQSPAAEGRFANISAASGIDYPDDARALALVDWDQDGDLDLWASNRNAPRLRLLRNEIPQSGHFVNLQLVGNGTTTNRDAIGARVEVVLAEPSSKTEVPDSPESPKSIRTLRAGEGFLSQNSKWLHFGLGKHEQIEKVLVAWPGGQKETFSGVSIDARNRLVQGTGTAETINEAPRKLHLLAKDQPLPDTSQTGTLRLVTPVMMPPIPYQTWDGTNHILDHKSGKPTLLILWASWCKPCLQELKQITESQAQLRRAGVNIIALSVDGVGADSTDPEASRRVLQSLRFPFESGLATTRLLQGLQKMHDRQAAVRRPLPLPTSLMLNREGELINLYKGPIELSVILDDIKHSHDTTTERIARSASISGRVLEHDTAKQVQAVAEAEQHFKTANLFQKNKLWEQALSQYNSILQLWPPHDTNRDTSLTSAENEKQRLISDRRQAEKRLKIQSMAYQNRALINQQLGNPKAALRDYEHLIALDPEDTQAYFRRANIYHKLGDYNLAVADYTSAIAQDPKFSEAYTRRADAYKQLGQNRLAADDYGRGTKLNPKARNAFKERAKLLTLLGDYDLAITDLSRALELDLQDAETLTNRGSLYADLGQFDLAQKDFTEAIRLNPENPAAYNNLAWLLATCRNPTYRNGEEAISTAKQACELLGWKSVDAFDTLAAAYAETGQFVEAIKWQNKAIASAAEENKQKLTDRLKLYQAEKPYRTH